MLTRDCYELDVRSMLADCRGGGWFVVRAGWKDRCPAGGESQAALGDWFDRAGVGCGLA